MFALRGIAVSLTFFVVLYCLMSALITVAWRVLKLLRVKDQSIAAVLFVLRVLPFAASVVVTFVFVVPSFQLLEPRSMDIDEGMGAMPLALGICALGLIACGCFRVIAAQIKTARVVARWLEGARLLNVNAIGQGKVQGEVQNEAVAATFCSSGATPPLTLVGIGKPRVVVSESTVALLNQDELRVALKHEFAHMRSRDN